MTKTLFPALALLIGCSAAQKPAPDSPANTLAQEAAGPAPDRPATPAERMGMPPERVPVIIVDGMVRPGTRVIALLDEAVGPQFSHVGQLVSATVIPAPREALPAAFPEGTQIVFRVALVQAAASGTLGVVWLVPRAIQYRGATFPIDARIVGVQFGERSTGRPVGGRSADMPGTIVDAKNLTPSDRERDILGKGTAISVGATPPDHQLAKGTMLAVELRGPVPMAFWEGKPGDELDLGWIRDLLALTESRDGSELVGKRIELRGIAVESVIGDVVFWVGPTKGQRVLVVMDQFLDAPEVKTVVVQGQTVNLLGSMEAMPSREAAPLLWSMVSDKEAADFAPHAFYVYATKIEITKAAPVPTKPVVKKAAKKVSRR